MRVVCVAGARPNFMKVKPVMDALEGKGIDVVLVHTGQHYDPDMSDVFFDELAIRPPDYSLEIGSGTHAEQTAAVMVAFEPLLATLRPQVVVVVGDVNSTLASAIVAAKAGPLVAHVEAGLRSGDWSMPEEINRVITDRASDLLFASSSDARDNLRAEGYRDDQIHLVGNVMVDTLLANLRRARARPVVEEQGLRAGAYGVVTLHRPSNIDDAVVFDRLIRALTEIARRVPLVWPVHPRARERVRAVDLPDGIKLVPPAGYLDFVALEASAQLVLTDSGGVQEETTILGVPCLTLRETTERPITVTEGTNTVVGVDPATIIATADKVLRHGVAARRPQLWDGAAGERIATVVVASSADAHRARPTERRTR